MTEDANVRAAIAHWAPRFVANGIDYNDFHATTARIGRWRDWCAEWMRTASVHERLANEAARSSSPVTAAQAYVRAALCHHFGKFVAFDDAEQYRVAGHASVENYGNALAALDPPGRRVAIAYAGTPLPGYLRLPVNASRPPVVVIVAGLDSVKEEMNAFESCFHRRGVATLSFDGPGQGESEALPIEPKFERAVSAVVDWLTGETEIDASRIGAVGISLGGYYVARAAAFETRLSCAASAGGFYDFGAAFPSMPEISREAFRIRSHLPDQATAFERARKMTLRAAAPRIEMPFTIVFGKKDRLIPYQHAERLFAEIGGAGKQLWLFDEGNHVCFNMHYAWRPQLADWFARNLNAGG